MSNWMCENVVFFAAKQASSPADVVGKLVEFGLSASSETRSFAEEIFSKVPHKASGLNVSSVSWIIFWVFCPSGLACIGIFVLILLWIVVVQVYQKQEREAAMLVRKQKTYAILDADDSDEDGGGIVDNRSSTAAPAASQSEKADTHKKRFRKKTENVEDDADDEV